MAEYICREAVLQTLQKANIGGYITERLLEIPSADVQPVNQWISVNDRLPDETETTVLIWIKQGKADGIEISDCCHIGYWVKNSKEFCDIDWNVINGITHWMPLPEPPKDGDAE